MKIEQIILSPMAVFCYLVYDEDSRTGIVIDPGANPRLILGYIKRYDITVQTIINTHGHIDHTAGNAMLKKVTGARILMHRDDLPILRTMTNRLLARFLSGSIPPLPDGFIREADEISIGRYTLRVMETPGHTPGGICLYGEGNIFTGDTLFTEGYGRTDLAGGSEEQLFRSIRESILALPGDTIIRPGHHYGRFPVSTVAEQLMIYLPARQ